MENSDENEALIESREQKAWGLSKTQNSMAMNCPLELAKPSLKRAWNKEFAFY